MNLQTNTLPIELTRDMNTPALIGEYIQGIHDKHLRWFSPMPQHISQLISMERSQKMKHVGTPFIIIRTVVVDL